MKKIQFAILGLGFAGIAWLALSRSALGHANQGRSLRSTEGETTRVSQAIRDSDAERAQASSAEVAELRAQLQERDKALGALMVQVAAASSREASAAEKAAETPAARAVALLDQRLFGGVLNAPAVREMEDAMNGALAGLPHTIKATVACSTELCKVTMDGPESELEKDAGSPIEHMPKKFGGSILLPDGDGHRALYAATRQELLSTADKQETAPPPADKPPAK